MLLLLLLACFCCWRVAQRRWRHAEPALSGKAARGRCGVVVVVVFVVVVGVFLLLLLLLLACFPVAAEDDVAVMFVVGVLLLLARCPGEAEARGGLFDFA